MIHPRGHISQAQLVEWPSLHISMIGEERVERQTAVTLSHYVAGRKFIYTYNVGANQRENTGSGGSNILLVHSYSVAGLAGTISYYYNKAGLQRT